MDITAIRKDFPLLARDAELAYLDNAATTQKPSCVMDAVVHYYETSNANPLRGLYPLSQAATDAYEDAREAVRGFLNAGSTEEIIFTRNASEGLNLAAYILCEGLSEGDAIALTVMEHHSDLIPWQQLAKRKGLVLHWIEPDEEGKITEDAFRAALTPEVKIVAMVQVSNVLGTLNDV